MKNKNAFTTVELLLVLSIIAVICAIVFAAFGPAREQTRQRVCVSNLHQIGLGVSLYIADYDGVDPIIGVPTSTYQLGLPGGDPHAADELFRKYIKSKEVRYCPSYHGTKPITTLTMTYMSSIFLTDDDFPDLQIPAMIAMRGADYPLAVCDQHNVFLDAASQPRWATKKVIVLRLN